MKDMNALLSETRKDKNVLAVMVFGSHARNEEYRDIDVCIVLNKRVGNGSMSEKRLHYVSEYNFDVHIFQQLPLYIRVRILREGKILFCRDIDALYDIASQTAREFGYFKPAYEGYLEAVAHG